MRVLWYKIWLTLILIALILHGPNYLHAAASGNIGMRIAMTGAGVAVIPFFLAKEAGLFKKHGLDVEVIYAPGNIALRALAAGEVDVISGAGAFAIIPMLQGLDIVILADVEQFLGYQLLVRRGIEKPAELIGKSLGISSFGTASDFGLRDMLQRVAVDPGRVAIVQIGDSSTRLGAVLSGRIDGTILNPPASFMARKKGLRVLLDGSKLRIPYSGGQVVTLRQTIKASPEKLRRFMKAHIEAIYLFKTNKEISLAALEKISRLSDREVLEETYSYYAPQFPFPPYPSREGILAILRTVASRIPAAKDAKPESFIDLSVVS
jgi:NitT/TauT family transport system substrate-binding protein